MLCGSLKCVRWNRLSKTGMMALLLEIRRRFTIRGLLLIFSRKRNLLHTGQIQAATALWES